MRTPRLPALRPLLAAVVLLAAVALPACSPAQEPAVVADAGLPSPQRARVEYPQDDTLRVHHLQAKGTHNSYHLERAGNDLQEWAYSHRPLDEQLGALGVRQIELDVTLRADGSGFDVFHIERFDAETTCARLEDCLRVIARWSDANPGHHPLFLQIEPKGGFYPDKADEYFRTFEAEILRVMPRERILTPDDVRGASRTLGEAVAERGWPTLREARGRVIFAFDTTGEIRTAYTRAGASLDGRLAFVDSNVGDPFGAIMVANDPVADIARIKRGVEGHFLVRTRADSDGSEARKNDRTRLEAALASGAHWISTDFPAPTPTITYAFDVPGGTPSRCNPLTAPKECAPGAIEEPGKLARP